MGTIFLDYSRGINDGFQPPGRLPKKELENTSMYTDKKENQIFLIHKEIQSGAVAKSYTTNGLLIYCMFKYLRISSYEEAIPHTVHI
jgi:hypothetical protein